MTTRSALVIVLSDAHNDPRVRRQIDWLHASGWTVDTLGLGPHPAPEVRRHFALGPQQSWVRTRGGAVVVHRVLTARARFRRLVIDRIHEAALRALRAGEYALIVFDDVDLAPLIADPLAQPGPGAARPHLHLDIHEYRSEPRVMTPWKRLTTPYRRWLRNFIGHPGFDSRTTVASRIAEMYANDFAIEPPVLVRNAPPFHDQRPSPVDPHEIKLVFHGLASWARGFEEIIAAMRMLDERFTMTFMLTGNPGNVERLRVLAGDLGDRVRIVPPVPMTELSATVNQYDIEIMFYPPVDPNVQFALPNKFFEAVQGRLAVVVGESPMMAELVRQYGIGTVVQGWTGADLARALESLTADDVAEFKRCSEEAARALNAEAEGRVFMSVVDHEQRAS